MRQIKENYSRHKLLRYGVFSVLALGSFFSLFYWGIRKLEQIVVFDAKQFNAGWTVTIDDAHFENVNLSGFSFPVVSKGTRIVLENVLPKIDISNPVLRLYTLYCTVDFYLDSEIVYSYGHDLAAKNKNVGCGDQIIYLTKYEENTPVKFVFFVTENNSFTSFQPLWIESAEKTFSNMLSGRLFVMFSSIFIFVLGITSSIVLIVFIFLGKPVAKILSLSQTLFWLGIFELYSNRCMSVFFFNHSLNTWIEYFSLYCTNFAVLSLFYTVMAHRRIEKRIVLWIMYAFAVYFALILLLDFSGILHLPSARHIQFTFFFIEIIFALYVCIRNVLLLFWQERLPAIGFLFLLFFIIVDVVRYPVQKYLMLNIPIMQGSLLSFGVLVFATALVESYLLQIKPDSEKKAMKILSEKHIRLDYQTGFLNAFALDEHLESIENAENDYIVIMIMLSPAGRDTPDLFSLDGTDFLVAFSKCVKKVFEKKSKIAYLENAEFCVVAANLRKEDEHRMIVMLGELLFTEIQKHPRYQYSMSSGAALRSEVDHSSHVLPLAKERMKAQKEGLRS
ncbi:MAG: hypothetical protein GX297_01390 [Treponema sp.]|nr:hypothetical protein [Treponema sp.]